MFGTRTSRPAKRKSAAQPFHWARFKSAYGSALLVVIILGMGAALTVGFEPLEARAMRILSGSKPVSVSIAWPLMDTRSSPAGPSATKGVKTWLPEQFQEQLLETATRALGTSADPYSRDALRRVGESMTRSGWFDGTPIVARRPGGEIHVDGTWRVGAAVVQQRDKLVLVSWNSKILPVEYDLDANLGTLAVITGVGLPLPRNADGTTDYSKAWEGSDLEAGLELLALVSRQPWRDQIRAVNVAEYRRTKQLAVETVRGGRVVWGGRPSAPLPGETSTREKLDKLVWLNRQYKSIDGGRVAIEISGQRPFEIDVSATSASAAGVKGQ